jgi:hypothetical protein
MEKSLHADAILQLTTDATSSEALAAEATEEEAHAAGVVAYATARAEKH